MDGLNTFCVKYVRVYVSVIITKPCLDLEKESSHDLTCLCYKEGIKTVLFTTKVGLI